MTIHNYLLAADTPMRWLGGRARRVARCEVPAASESAILRGAKQGAQHHSAAQPRARSPRWSVVVTLPQSSRSCAVRRGVRFRSWGRSFLSSRLFAALHCRSCCRVSSSLTPLRVCCDAPLSRHAASGPLRLELPRDSRRRAMAAVVVAVVLVVAAAGGLVLHVALGCGTSDGRGGAGIAE